MVWKICAGEIIWEKYEVGKRCIARSGRKKQRFLI